MEVIINSTKRLESAVLFIEVHVYQQFIVYFKLLAPHAN